MAATDLHRGARWGYAIWWPHVLVLAIACAPGDGGVDAAALAHLDSLTTPDQHLVAEQLYNANCARCHGVRGVGTTAGPPLVHRIYEPRHHADFAFQRAVTMGAPAHHWRFGDMEPIEGITGEEITLMTGYVRWLQREVGIN